MVCGVPGAGGGTTKFSVITGCGGATTGCGIFGFAAGGESALGSNSTVSMAEYKKLVLENQRLKAIVIDKELEIQINAELLKKTTFHKLNGK